MADGFFQRKKTETAGDAVFAYLRFVWRNPDGCFRHMVGPKTSHNFFLSQGDEAPTRVSLRCLFLFSVTSLTSCV